jgi:tetratricopeptide (TPR) repeat protein
MEARLTRTSGIAALALTVAALLVPADAFAQDGRSRVLIPDLFPAEGTRDNFGKDVAKELREIMDDQVLFVAIERDEIEDALDGLDMDMDELNCVFARQLARQVSASAIFCADYQDVGNDMMEFTEISVHSVSGDEPFQIGLFTIDKDEEEEAAMRIMREFDAFVELSNFRRYCYDYSQLEQWADAERNCSLALEAVPEDIGIRFQVAQIYRAQERLEDALAEIDIILADEQGQFNEDALNTGGYLASQLGQSEKAREYYTRYLQAVPDASAVRRNIAYEMYQAGDPQGAMQLLEEGLGPDAVIGIYSDYGTYAFNSALQMLQQAGIDPSNQGAEIPADVEALYRTAIDALERVYEVRGDSANAGTMRNVVRARIQLGELAEAESFGSQLTRTFPDNGDVWVAYAQALQLQEKIDGALEAWREVERINPGYPNLYTRQAALLLNAGRRDDAVRLFQRAVADGFSASQAARLIFNDAYSKGSQGDLGAGYTIEGIQAAKQFDADAETVSMLDFFHGYVLYQQGVQIANVQQSETATAAQKLQSAQRALPVFQQSRQLLDGGRTYASTSGQDIASILDAVQQYIEIQTLLIERGR